MYMGKVKGGAEAWRDDRGVVGPLSWQEALQVTTPKPILLDNMEQVRRNGSGVLVPSFLLEGNIWTQMTALDGSTYVGGSPPDGWVEDGSVTAAAGYIDIAGASGATASLTFTIPDLLTDEALLLVFSGYGDSIAGSTSNESQILLTDSRATKNVKHVLERGASSVAYFRGTGAESPQTDPIESLATYYIMWRNPAVVDTTYAVELSGTRRWKIEQASWTGAGATDTISLVSSQLGGGGGSGHMYVGSFKAFRGVLA